MIIILSYYKELLYYLELLNICLTAANCRCNFYDIDTNKGNILYIYQNSCLIVHVCLIRVFALEVNVSYILFSNGNAKESNDHM